MAKTNSIEGMTKSDIVREYVARRPNATAREVVAGLRREQGVDVSYALASKVKSDANRQAPPAAGRASARHTSNRNTNGGSKADMIREVARTMPKPIRPRDVMAALAEQGIQVSRGQVSQVLKRMGLRRRRSRKAAGGSTAGVGRASAAAGSPELSLEALLAAKKLATQLGSVAAAKQAVDALARLS